MRSLRTQLSADQGIDISHPEMAKKVPNDYDRIRDGAEVEVINSAFLGDNDMRGYWQYVTMTDGNPASDLTSLNVAIDCHIDWYHGTWMIVSKEHAIESLYIEKYIEMNTASQARFKMVTPEM